MLNRPVLESKHGPQGSFIQFFGAIRWYKGLHLVKWSTLPHMFQPPDAGFEQRLFLWRLIKSTLLPCDDDDDVDDNDNVKGETFLQSPKQVENKVELVTTEEIDANVVTFNSGYDIRADLSWFSVSETPSGVPHSRTAGLWYSCGGEQRAAVPGLSVRIESWCWTDWQAK